MNISLITLVIVFALIALRQVGNIRFQIWQVMLLGSAAVLLTGQITPELALRAINVHVMVFLLAMFIIGQALLQAMSSSFKTRRRKQRRQLLFGSLRRWGCH